MTDKPGLAATFRCTRERTFFAMQAASLPLAAALALAGCNASVPAPSGLTAAPTATVAYNRDAAFSVGVAPDRAPPLRLGETLGFRLSSSADGYGHLYLLNASGGVLAVAENLPLRAGGQTAFPPPGAGYVFRASPPAGVERLLFLATRQLFDGFAGGAAKAGPVQLPIGAKAFVKKLNAATAALPKGGWALAEERIEIVGGHGGS
ncbi:MAG: DUF4384 domain-containing protein [Alphaproteobacteria bacterium]|nr:DUF4384 domain-containing protein [Alphaproteobacteria bacterium]